MPLISMCGLPNSGKSVRCAEIVAYLSAKHPEVEIIVISEDSLHLQREVAYQSAYTQADSKQEKDTRGTLKSEVDRWLTKDNLIILDSLNYIKGFRYELYCISRAQASPHCVVFVDTPIELCKEWKVQKPNKDTFPDQLMDELAFRFEKPIGKNRWDAPLFHLRPLEMNQPKRDDDVLIKLEDIISDAPAEPRKEASEFKYFKDIQVLEEINQALFHGVAPKPNLATQPQKLENTNFVHELDRITQAIISSILESQNTAIIGDPLPVPETKLKVTLRRKTGMAELRRQRRRFLKLAQTNPPKISQIADTFVSFLNSTFETE